jgi:hypothetical protein
MFDGESGDWKDWCQGFERSMWHAGITEESDVAFRFSECLQGQALSYFNRLSVPEQTRWTDIKAMFDRRFGPEASAYEARRELNGIHPREGEPAEAYKHRFLSAWEKVFTKSLASPTEANEYMVEKFLDSLGDQQLVVFIGNRGPQTLNDCCAAMHTYLRSMARATIPSAAVAGAQFNRVAPQKAQQKSDAGSEAEALRREIAELKKRLDERSAESASPQTNSNRGRGRGRGGSRGGRSNDSEYRRMVLPDYILNYYRLPSTTHRKGCWWCGHNEQPYHNIHRCPVRLKLEQEKPGSTVKFPGPEARLAEASVQVRQEQGNC